MELADKKKLLLDGRMAHRFSLEKQIKGLVELILFCPTATRNIMGNLVISYFSVRDKQLGTRSP